MGNTTSCCVSSNPKLRRNANSWLESYRPDTDLSRKDTGCNLHQRQGKHRRWYQEQIHPHACIPPPDQSHSMG